MSQAPSRQHELEDAIAAMDAQREALGDSVVDLAIKPLLAELESLRQDRVTPSRADDDRQFMLGERKLVTVVFADLSGFSAMAESTDPEHLRELTNACFDHLVPIIERYGGNVDKFIGDSIVALFGAPIAHETDPECALLASLDIMSELEGFNEENDTELGIHIGVNTGLVIAGGIGSLGRQQYSVLGDAVNIAARLEEASSRGEIFVGPDTRRFTEHLFEFEELGSLQVQGREEPVRAFRLVRKRVARSRRRKLDIRSATVGRDPELDMILNAVRAMGSESSGTIAVIGEAGIGKSRLIDETHDAIDDAVRWAEGAAMPHTRDLAYGIAGNVLRGLLELEPDTPDAEVAVELRSRIDCDLGNAGTTKVWPYIGHLLDLELDEDAAALVAQFKQEPLGLPMRISEAYTSFLARCCPIPLVAVWEDVHWADAASLSLLEDLVRSRDIGQVLFVLAFRPEEGLALETHRKLISHPNYEAIELQPLSENDASAMVENLVGTKLDAQMAEAIMDKAEGNPLFVEELAGELVSARGAGRPIESGRQTAIPDILALPDTLQGVIAARIDRLPAVEKQILQTASVLGRRFHHSVLDRLVSRENGANVRDSLDELRRRDFVRTRHKVVWKPGDVETEYIFKHVLTQEAAYNSLLVARRREIHHQAGEVLEDLYKGRRGDIAATLAYHYEEAEVPDRAAKYLLDAGTRAASLSAHDQAAHYFRRGLTLLEEVPEGAARTNLELELRLRLGGALRVMRGYGAPDVGEAFGRVYELLTDLGGEMLQADLLSGLWAYNLATARYEDSRYFAELMLQKAAKSENPEVLTALGHNSIGTNLLLTGSLKEAWRHLRKVPEIDHPSTIPVIGQEIDNTAMTWGALASWLLGLPADSLDCVDRGIARGRELGHPYTLGFSLFGASMAAFVRHDVEAALEISQELLDLSYEHGFMLGIATGGLTNGWARSISGDAKGLDDVGQGLAMLQMQGTKALTSIWLALAAEAHVADHQLDAASQFIDEALQHIETACELFFNAELLRLKAELVVASDDRVQSESLLSEALDAARAIGARASELRCYITLIEITRYAAAREQALQDLDNLVKDFDSGHDTPDLRKAATLLN